MSASIYELLKYGKTGIAAPDMTHYDKRKALAMFGSGWSTKTISGVPPISFKSDGTPLTAYSITGNGRHSLNLFDCDRTDGIIDNSYINKRNSSVSTLSTYYLSYPISVTVGSTYRWEFNEPDGQKHSAPTVGFYDNTDTLIDAAYHTDEVTTFTFTVPENCAYIRASVYKILKAEAMLTLGDAVVPYEPYGYVWCGDKTINDMYTISIVLAGQTKKVYMFGPLRKALDGSNAADILSYPDGILTRYVDSDGNALETPTTESANMPKLTPQNGSNTLTVDTTLPPSGVSITGGIK